MSVVLGFFLSFAFSIFYVATNIVHGSLFRPCVEINYRELRMLKI